MTWPRSLYGATGWAGDGRPLTQWLMELLAGGGGGVADLVAAAHASGAGGAGVRHDPLRPAGLPGFTGQPVGHGLPGLVVAQPFAMANLSYKFDCLTMLLALAFCFLLYALPDTLGGPRLALAGAVAALVVMDLYQPASGLFLVLAGIWLVFWLLERAGQQRIPEKSPAPNWAGKSAAWAA